MSVVCQNCGARVELPAGYSRAKIRCVTCGYYAEVPADQRGTGEEEPPPPPPTRRAPVRATPAPPPPPVEAREEKTPGTVTGWGTGKEDEPDLNPYGFAPSNPVPPPPKPKQQAPKPAVRAKPQVDPRDVRPYFEPTPNANVPPLLEGTRDEDDEKPYGVPGVGLKKCPECRGELPLDADFCVHCGTEIGTKAKAVREYQPIAMQWHEGWSPMLRLQLFAGIQVLNFFAAVMLVMSGDRASFSTAGGICTMVVTQGIQIAMQAFLLGTYDTLFVKRTAKGQATMWRVRRLAFVPMPLAKISWRQSTNIGIAAQDVGWFPKLLCLYFVLNGCFYVITGIFFSVFTLGLAAIYFAVAAGFYWVVLRPSRFEVNLCDVYGSTDEMVFRCEDREQSEEVAKTIADATGLYYKPVQ